MQQVGSCPRYSDRGRAADVLHSQDQARRDTMINMTGKLKELLERLESWPKEAQDEALESLQAIEEDFVPDAELARDLARAEGEMRRGGGTPQEEVFKRFGV